MPSSPAAGRYRTGRPGQHASPVKTRRRWPWILIGCIVIVLTPVGIVGGIFIAQAVSVQQDLAQVKQKLSAMPALMQEGKVKRIRVAAEEISVLSAQAETTSRGEIWNFVRDLPGMSPNIDAVRTATATTKTLIEEALPPGVEILSILQPDKLKVAEGGIDLAPFEQVQTALPTLAAAFQKANAQVATIDRSALLPVVDESVGELLTVVEQAGPALETAQQILPVVLDMAGSDGERNYLVVFQNNAEIRATGGNAATSTLIRVNDGKIEKVDDDDLDDFLLAGIRGTLRSDLPDETLELYEDDFARYAQNFSRTPDFPTTASMFSQLWTQTNGTELDGVISLDPVALSYMLAATGPVKLSDGSSIDSGNAVSVLLSETYERFGTNGLAADAFFADTAARVFDKIASGAWDAGEMARQLVRSVDEGRIFAWFPRAEEETMSVDLGIDGALTADNVLTTQVGTFLNNASYSKLEYYLNTAVAVSCDPTARTITTTTTLNSTVPGSNISGYALGYRNPSLGLPRTSMILDVLSVAPPGSTITASDPSTGDMSSWDREGVENGHPVVSRSVVVPMGESRTVSFTAQLPEGPLGPLEVRSTPTVTTTPVTVDGSCGALFPAAVPTLLDSIPLPTSTPTAEPAQAQ